MKEELVQLEILKGEKITATLANVVTKLAISANAHAKETKARITTLWPSMQKQLQAQMAFFAMKMQQRKNYTNTPATK